MNMSYSLVMLKLFTTIALKRRLFKIPNLPFPVYRMDYPRGIFIMEAFASIIHLFFADFPLI